MDALNWKPSCRHAFTFKVHYGKPTVSSLTSKSVSFVLRTAVYSQGMGLLFHFLFRFFFVSSDRRLYIYVARNDIFGSEHHGMAHGLLPRPDSILMNVDNNSASITQKAALSHCTLRNYYRLIVHA